MKSNYGAFVERWHEMVEILAAIFLFISISIVLSYLIGLVLGRNRSKRYFYISSKELNAFNVALIFFAISLSFYVNSLLTYSVKTSNNTELTVEVVSSFFVGGIVWFILKNVLNIYYPSLLEKRLTKIRFAEKRHPVSGNKMRLLNEEEEDVHLTDEMIEHENIFAFDYDVWLDEETNDKIIEKYDVHYTHRVCPNCKFRTLKEKKEEILEKPTSDAKGRLIKYFNCSFCGHEVKEEVNVAPLEVT